MRHSTGGGFSGGREFARGFSAPRGAAGPARRLQRLEWLAWLLDRSVPIGRWRIGLDPLLGLVPGVGDGLGAVLSLYVLYEGARLGVPGRTLTRMAGNILVEALVGAIPLFGDLFDFAWQANTRNLALIRGHKPTALQPRSLRWVGVVVLGFAFLVLMAIGVLAYMLAKAGFEILERTGLA